MDQHHHIAYLLLLLVAGCASAPPDQHAASAAPQSCERHYRVGSIVPTKDCLPALTEEERQRNIEELRNSIRQGTPLPRSGGG